MKDLVPVKHPLGINLKKSVNSNNFKIKKKRIQPQQVISKLSNPASNVLQTPAKKILKGDVVTPNSKPTSERKRKRGTGPSTGCSLFSVDTHLKVRAENPALQFAEISKLVIFFGFYFN